MGEEEARFCFVQILVGLQYLHEQHVVYRDIKPENIMIDLNGNLKIAGTVTADSPWNVYSNIELDNIDGANIIYPMGGYAHYAANWFFKSWNGDPAKSEAARTGQAAGKAAAVAGGAVSARRRQQKLKDFAAALAGLGKAIFDQLFSEEV